MAQRASRAASRAARRGAIAVLGAALAVAAGAAGAALFVPQRDEEVVQRLPVRIERSERERLAALARDPAQLPLALGAARAAVERARQTGDPREWGVAQAALRPWWTQSEAPPAVRLLRATVLQGVHRFDEALADLAALQRQRASLPAPVWLQATLSEAALLQLTGRWDEARERCRQLLEAREAAGSTGARHAARACIAEIDSLRGKPREADAALDELAREAPQDTWVGLLRAERAERAGRSDEALSLYRQLLAQRPGVYTRAAAADALLAAARPREALALLGDDEQQADALRLRRAIAWHRLGDKRASDEAAALRKGFAAAARRGEALHRREEARLALELGGDVQLALQLARDNWARQKEPADALLLWQAAHAAGQPAAAEPIRALVQGGWQDLRLAAVQGPVKERP